jgi:argininosuccinate synthase
MARIVLAYSGGLNSSVAIPWLIERHAAEIVAVTIDLGQGRELEAVRDRALVAGARRAHVLDLREEFARDYILPTLKADAIGERHQPLAAVLGRPVIAEKLVEIAAIEMATVVAYGGCGASRDPLWLETITATLNPALQVLAPAREWRMTECEAIAYARRHGVSIPAAVDSPDRIKANLWGRTVEHRRIAGAPPAPTEDSYRLTKSAADCPDEAAAVEITFSRGVPIAINGVAMPMLELIASLSTIAGAHGVGRHRTELVEDASWQISEAPAAVVLHAAHQAIQQLVTATDLARVCRVVSREYAAAIRKGLWFTPLRHALDGFVESVQERVNGTVRVKLYKGEFSIEDNTTPAGAITIIEPPAAPSLRQPPATGRKKMSVGQ